ncbi:MAG: cation:proton antiporter [Planctomycetes bacterium]|nr:cation:proton antiporter [Planctomycetota bacterium]
MEPSLYIEISVVIIGASILSYLSIIGRLPVVLAYLLCGVIAGPWGLKWVHAVDSLTEVSELGITLLLFLAGVELHPRRLKELFTKTAFATVFSCCLSGVGVYAIMQGLGYSFKASVLIAMSMIFSSTILAIKLLPTTTLHHQFMGAYCIAILIFQDIIAIVCIMALSGSGQSYWQVGLLLPLKGIFLLSFSFLVEQYALRPIMRRCESIDETLYLFPLAWCLSISLLSGFLGFSHEIGAFIAGFALTRSPISQFLMEKLKLLRDFFLLFFFFTLGASLDLIQLPSILIPSLILALAVMLFKVISYYSSIRIAGENHKFSVQAGVRLAQASEFSIIISLIAYKHDMLSSSEIQLIQFTTILTFLFSSYLVCNLYRTPWTAARA